MNYEEFKKLVKSTPNGQQIAINKSLTISYFDFDINGYKGHTLLDSLPENLVVKGDLTISGCTKLQSLPDNFIVGGSLNLDGCVKLTTLPENLTVERNLDLLECTGFKSLPINLTVKNNLFLDKCTNLLVLPDNLIVGETLFLERCPNLTIIPDNLTVNGSLVIEDCPSIASLPNNLNIKGSLSIKQCPGIQEIPWTLCASGGLFGFLSDHSLSAITKWNRSHELRNHFMELHIDYELGKVIYNDNSLWSLANKAQTKEEVELIALIPKNIAEIALETGSVNESHFTKMFKKIIRNTTKKT